MGSVYARPLCVGPDIPKPESRLASGRNAKTGPTASDVRSGATWVVTNAVPSGALPMLVHVSWVVHRESGYSPTSVVPFHRASHGPPTNQTVLLDALIASTSFVS